MQRLAANEILHSGDSQAIQKFLAAALFSSILSTSLGRPSPCLSALPGANMRFSENLS